MEASIKMHPYHGKDTHKTNNLNAINRYNLPCSTLITVYSIIRLANFCVVLLKTPCRSFLLSFLTSSFKVEVCKTKNFTRKTPYSFKSLNGMRCGSGNRSKIFSSCVHPLPSGQSAKRLSHSSW